MSRSLTSLLLAVALGACAGADDSVGPNDLNPPTDTSQAPQTASRLGLHLDTNAVYVGMHNWLIIDAYDGKGISMSSDSATVLSSNPAVATIADSRVVPVRDLSNRVTRQLYTKLDLLSTGTTTLSVTIGSVTDSVILRVLPVASHSTALVVDSFTVIEYRVQCVSACPYLAYAPLLKLREPTGTAVVEVIGVRFTVPTKGVGMCTGSVHYAPAQSAHLNGIDPYLWANDLIFVSLDGTPLPDGAASAEVLVRDPTGVVGRIEATGTIQRMVSNPDLPPPVFDGGWIC